MADVDLSRLPDGAVLRTLASGLQIIRRKKHEWAVNGLDGLSAQQLAVRTNKKWGSKFRSDWTIARIRDWTAAQVEAAGWTLDEQQPNPLEVRMPVDVGLFEGKTVRTIHIRSDGRNVHAYPVED